MMLILIWIHKKMQLDCESDFENADKIMDEMYFEKQGYLWVREKEKFIFYCIRNSKLHGSPCLRVAVQLFSGWISSLR